MNNKRKILFLCTGNACRSQMAEAILRHVDSQHFDVLSAGSHPAGFIHELAIEAMRQLHIPIEDQHSKSWDAFKDESLDAVITLCDAAAALPCPVWPGKPLQAHWPLPDPSYHAGSTEDRVAFAIQVAKRLTTKIKGLVELDWSADQAQIKQRLDFLGEI